MVRDLESSNEEFDSSNLLFEWFTEVYILVVDNKLYIYKTGFRHLDAQKRRSCNESANKLFTRFTAFSKLFVLTNLEQAVNTL